MLYFILIMRFIQCAICETDSNSKILFKESLDFPKIDKNLFSARRIPDQIHYRLNKCLQCGLIYSSPILSPAKINNLYRKSSVTYEDEIKSIQQTYGQNLKYVLPLVKPDPALLEIGAGNGFFLEIAKDLGVVNFYGIEPGMAAVSQARKDIKQRLIVDFFPSKKIKNLSFDIICCFHTLDHVLDPNTFLSSAFKILKKGGIMLTIVHNTDGLSVKILGEKSPIFDIEHIYLFNKKTLRKIFEKNGFTILELFDVINTYPLSYWLKMLPLKLSIKNQLVKFLEFIKLNNLPLSLKAGNIGIIAKKY